MVKIRTIFEQTVNILNIFTFVFGEYLVPSCCPYMGQWFGVQLKGIWSWRNNVAIISPLLSDLHWLSIVQRIRYKISTLCYSVISGSATPYLSDLVQLHIPSRTLRTSADTRTFRVPRRHKKFQGQRAFSYITLALSLTWNSLPFAVHHAHTLTSLKTSFFCQSK